MASTYLTRTMSGNSNQKVFTLSVWLKRNGLGRQVIMGVGGSGNYAMELYFTSGNQIDWWNYFNGAYAGRKVTNRVFRDTNGWLHIVARWDTTDSTAANRMRLYVNGVEETSFSTDSDPNLNQTSEWNSASVHEIGRNGNSSYCFDGAMSHIHFVDGSALAPTVFGETDATTGEWKINTSPSFTPGSNGFTILKDGNTVTDQSANSNDFSVAAGTLTKTEDCPSNVFATFNPLAKHPSCGISFANGNNKITTTTSRGSVPSTLGFNSGKYYFEFDVVTAAQDGRWEIGIQPFANVEANDAVNSNNKMIGLNGYNGYIYYSGSSINNFYNTVGGFTSFTGIIGVAVDLDSSTKTMAISRDGAWITGQNATDTNFSNALKVDITSSVANYDFWHFGVGTGNGSGTAGVGQANFGNGYFGTTAVSSAGTNASSNGIFEYDVPTGYTALSTKGLNL